MAKAATDRKEIRWVVEGSYGAGAAGAKMADLRLTSESLKQTTETRSSEELDSTRNITDVKRTNKGVTGSIEGELTYGTYDNLMMYALQAASWSSQVTETDTTYSMANGDNSINDSANGFVTDGFLAGQWIITSGFTVAANNGIFKIVSVAAGKMVLSHGTVTTEAAGDTVTITMEPQIVNGTTFNSISVEREYSDLSQEFVEFQGIGLDVLRIGVDSKSVVTIGFDCIGESETSGTVTSGDGSPTAVNTNTAFSTQGDVQAIYENGSSTEVSSFSIELANTLRARDMVLGTLGPESIGSGKCRVSGTVEALYESKTIYDKYLNFTDTSLAIKMTDSAGNTYVMEVISCNYTDGDRSGGGTEEDIIMITPYEGKKDSTEAATFRIVRFPA